MSTHHAILIVGPSGCGKSTILNSLIERGVLSDKLVSITTRPMREGETDGDEFSFITPVKFAAIADADELFEYMENYGRHYGITRTEVYSKLASGHVGTITTLPGTVPFKIELGKHCTTIFIKPPSIDVLRERLGDRNNIEGRLQAAVKEIEGAHQCDYVVTNGDLCCTVDICSSIIDNVVAHT